MAGGLGARDRRDGCGVLRVDMTSATVAETVVHARGAILVRARVHGRRAGKWMPAERAAGARHLVEKRRSAQRRHRIPPLPGTLERIAARIDFSTDVARLSGHPDFVLDPVVIRLQFLEAEWPVLD